MYVDHRYALPPGLRAHLKAQTPHFGFNGLGETAFYRSYSRPIEDAFGNTTQEDWADVVCRVMEGTFSIYKDTVIKQGKDWDEEHIDDTVWDMAQMMFDMKWLPPGRGLWMGGTEYMYERGSAAMFNCAYVDVAAKNPLSHDCGWITDFLMCGIGVGFSAEEKPIRFAPLKIMQDRVYQIPDTREGWAESVRLLIESYERGTHTQVFDYSLLRPRGEPIKGFGGVASGPGPLIELHERIDTFCMNYIKHMQGRYPDYTATRLIADIVNAIGVCVVAGNVRRSAEIMVGNLDDHVFVDLKNSDRFPERKPWMHLSNNSVRLYDDPDFEKLPEIAERIRDNGEPGFLNMINIRNYGRFGDHAESEILPGYVLPKDYATGANPCSEIPLESYETCCLSEVFLPNCKTDEEIFKAMEYATIYATCIQWLPTHRSETNEINERNRRIGVSLSGIFDWYEREGTARLVRIMRDGYKLVRVTNHTLADEVGYPRAVRVTTVKPSGTVSKLAGCSSGIHAPEYDTFLRRIRIDSQWPGRSVLDNAGIPSEPDLSDKENTVVYEFPIAPKHPWPIRTVKQVSMWEQASLVMAAQRHWADNMVSVTIKYDPQKDGDDLEKLLALYASMLKSASMLPIFDPEVKMLMAPMYDSFSGDILKDSQNNVMFDETVLWTPEEVEMAERIVNTAKESNGYAYGEEPYIAKKVAFEQLPEEPITREEYNARAATLGTFDWSHFTSNDNGSGERYCTSDACEVDIMALHKERMEAEALV